jgi:integrase
VEAVEKLAAWLAIPSIGDHPAAPLFRPQRWVRGGGTDEFRPNPMKSRALEKLIERYVKALMLDPNVNVHSLRVTVLTRAKERAGDIVDTQGFGGHSDSRTAPTYIRTRDRRSKNPAYVPRY